MTLVILTRVQRDAQWKKTHSLQKRNSGDLPWCGWDASRRRLALCFTSADSGGSVLEITPIALLIGLVATVIKCGFLTNIPNIGIIRSIWLDRPTCSAHALAAQAGPSPFLALTSQDMLAQPAPGASRNPSLERKDAGHRSVAPAGS